MNNGTEVLEKPCVAKPGRNCYHQRMKERDDPNRDLMTMKKIYIPLKKIAVEDEDPAVILENLEERYIRENGDNVCRNFH